MIASAPSLLYSSCRNAAPLRLQLHGALIISFPRPDSCNILGRVEGTFADRSVSIVFRSCEIGHDYILPKEQLAKRPY